MTYQAYQNVPEENQKYFKPVDVRKWYLVALLVIYVIWCFLAAQYLKSINKKDHAFRPFAISLIALPLVIWAWRSKGVAWLIDSYRFRQQGKENKIGSSSNSSTLLLPRNRLWSPVDYGSCFDPKLTPQESQVAVGKFDYLCTQEQVKFMAGMSDEFVAKAYYQLYTLFSVVLLLFTHVVRDHTSFYLDSSNLLIKALIKASMIISLVLLSAPILLTAAGAGLPTLMVAHFYKELITMNVITLGIFLAYLIFKLAASGVKI